MMLATLLCLAAAPTPVEPTPVEPAPVEPAAGELDWPVIARESLELYGYDPDEVGDLDLEQFLEGTGFLRAELGGLEVRIPVVLKDQKEPAEDIARAAQDLIALQEHWIRWTAGPDADLGDVEKDLATLSKWAKSWSYRNLKHATPEPGVDLRQQIKTNKKVHGAAERLAELFLRGDRIGVERVEGERARIVLAATRESFVRLAAIGGKLSPPHRPTLWHDSIVDTMAYWFGPSQVVCMEYAAYPIDLDQPYLGAPMGVTTKTRQRQHVVDRGAATLLRGYLYRHEFHFLESALATNLVVATIGENDLALLGHFRDYTRGGASSQPYERFVPGGDAGGGLLPPATVGHRGGKLNVKDIPTWFRALGRDYYVEALRDAQKEGSKRASRVDSGVSAEQRQWKEAHFEVSSRKSHRKVVVSAPFFGEAADRKELPDNEFIDDYEDFFSTYKACFFEWVRTRGNGDESLATFRDLLRRLIAQKGGEDLRAIVRDLYGMPISERSGEEDSLEWRFLDWLSRQR